MSIVQATRVLIQYSREENGHRKGWYYHEVIWPVGPFRSADEAKKACQRHSPKQVQDITMVEEYTRIT